MRRWAARERLSTWTSEFVPLSSRTTSTLSRQSKLPRLPVPDLRDTVDGYLKSLEPFYTITAALDGSSIHSLKSRQHSLAREFLHPGGIGEKLQQRLIELDHSSPFNWLDDTIWMRVAYHEWRQPLLINSNWWLLLQDDPTVPQQARESMPSLGTATMWQIRRAAWLVKRFLDYRDKLESRYTLIHRAPVRSACYNITGKWFRGPALRLFGTTRIPRLHCDTLIGPANEKNRWVHVMFREWSYRILVYNKSGTRISPATLENALAAVVSDVRNREAARESCLPVGRLTADHRDTWARNREHLLSLSPTNAENMARLETCLFTVSLDDYTYSTTSDASGALLGHIRNISSGVDATNRWFDKSMSLIVESNARFGIMGEHSPVDALIPSIIADWAVSEPIDLSVFTESHSESEKMFELLAWQADEYISSECHLAKERAGAIINDSDTNVLRFREYGIGWIKETAQLSPDAYIQMALQLAWFKSTGTFTATYETASTRLFLHGRTETIRTLSLPSMAFAQSMVDPCSEDTTRYRLLRHACHAHNVATRNAAIGKGIDRHLLGLRLQLRPDESSPLLSDDLFHLSQEWKLSTSGLSAGDRFLATGFGAVCPDGYGINYLTGSDMLKFGIESKHSSSKTSTLKFMGLLAESLREMRVTCSNAMIGECAVESKL